MLKSLFYLSFYSHSFVFLLSFIHFLTLIHLFSAAIL